MAGVEYSGVYLYNKTGELLIYKYDNSRIDTVQEVLESQQAIAAGVSEISGTIGGQALSSNADLHTFKNPDDGYAYVYDVTPEPQAETITGFYLDGTEYKFEGGGGTADGISTSQPSNPVAGSTYYDTTNKVVKVYNGTSWEEVGGGNVIAMTQAQYDALPEATKNDGKLRIITDAPSIEMASKAYVDGLVGDVETLLAAL